MRYLTLIALALMATSAQADFWDNCTAYGGTIITANSYGNDKGGLCNDPNNTTLTNNCNGKRFCSGPHMNWWSSFTWCETIGGRLASFADMCPGVQINNSGVCPNLKGVAGGNKWWSSQGWSTGNAIMVNNGGSIVSISRSKYRTGVNDAYACCEE